MTCNYVDQNGKCTAYRYYGFPDNWKKERCKNHKLEGMISLQGKRCAIDDCISLARYNYEGFPMEFCNNHKKTGMIRITGTFCKDPLCNKQPIFNYPNNPILYCKDHKKSGMIDVRKNKCKKCSKRAQYGYFSDRVKEYCGSHKENDMIDLSHKLCEYSHPDHGDCYTRANFNYEHLIGKGIFCDTHKMSGMINVMDKRCDFIDDNGNKCDRMPTYGIKNTKTALRCVNHKELRMTDVKKRKCKFIDIHGYKCDKLCYYNFMGEDAPLYCRDHKLNDMVDLVHYKCNRKGCSRRPSHNHENKNPEYCHIHKTKDMIDIASLRCRSEFCNDSALDYLDNYCLHCFSNIFPTDKRIKDLKTTKEIKTKFLLSLNENDDFIHNKPIYVGDCGVSKRRIDLYKYLGDNHILCIEIDENQHKHYDQHDEEMRYHDVYNTNYYMIFIRFNPDKYIDKDGNICNPPLEERVDDLTTKLYDIECNLHKYSDPDQLLYIENMFFDQK